MLKGYGGQIRHGAVHSTDSPEVENDITYETMVFRK